MKPRKPKNDKPLRGTILYAEDTPESRAAERDAIQYIFDVNEQHRRKKKKKALHDDQTKSNPERDEAA
jgi:hypothetical protein